MKKSSSKKIVYFQRKRRNGQNFSIEQIFKDVRKRLPERFQGILKVSSYESRGILQRFKAILEAKKYQGDINHITGDIHFINLLFSKHRTILTIHDIRFMDSERGFKKFLLKLFWLVIPIFKSEIVTVVSNSTKAELLKHTNTNTNKIVVVPASISKRFKFYYKEFNSNKPTLLQIGTATNKNLHRVIIAIKGLTCKLDIVGKLDEITTNLLIANKIDYINSYDLDDKEILSKYYNCDIVIFISTYEGFGMPIIEANLVGRPVVTGNIFSMPEIAGNAACIVDPYSIDSIRSGINKIIIDQNYRKTLIENGIENAKRFSSKKTAEIYFKLYDKIIEKNK